MSDNKKEIDDMILIKIWNLTNLNKLIEYTLRRDNIDGHHMLRSKIKTVLLRHARLAVKEIKHIIAKKDK